jgi:hypothetical protein
MKQTIQIETEIEADGIYCLGTCANLEGKVPFVTCSAFRESTLRVIGRIKIYVYRCQKCLDAKVVK